MLWLMSHQMILCNPWVIIDCWISQKVRLNSISLDCDTQPAEELQVNESDAISDLNDPAKWSVINDSLRTALVKHGPFQVKNFKGPKNDQNRRFSSTHFIRRLENGESIERQWLVYSTSNDTVFCFCCKLFSTKAIPLAECGYQNWRHLPEALSGHERSSSHVEAFGKWKELELRLRLGVSIDQTNQKIQQERVEYWRQILRRLISVIRLIATQNLALRGSSDTLLSAHNGIFLKIVELLGKFDPLMHEHIQRSSSKEIKTHYLGKTFKMK